MNKRAVRSLFSILAFVLSSAAFAQAPEYCGTTEVDESWLKHFVLNKASYASLRDCDVLVPLTVHVLGDDNGIGYHPYSTIFKSLETLNSDFEVTGVRFYLAGPINYINNSAWYNHTSFGVGSQMMNANNVSNTVNCYIVENPADNCGYRSYAGDAIALRKSCTGASDHTWAHEIGHYFGLPHTFRGWEGIQYSNEDPTPSTIGSANVELLDGSNCDSAGDFFCDTPPDYISYRWNCDDQNENPDSLMDPSGQKFKADGSYFMSYANDRCQSRFSPEQNLSMCSYLENITPELISQNIPLEDINPSETNLIFPIGGQKVENNVTLKWEENGNATFYILEVSKIPNLGLPSFREIVYGTSFELFGLAEEDDYYWRIRTLSEYDFDYNKKTAIEHFKTGKTSSTAEFYATHLKVLPNPLEMGQVLNVELNSHVSEDVNIQIYSIEGKLAFSDDYFFKNGNNRIEITLPSIGKGIYILKGRSQNHNFLQKIVIE